MSRSHKKCIAAFCKANGWSMEPSKAGHIKLTHPEVPGFVTTASTPSCSRAFLNTRSILLRKMKESGVLCDNKSLELFESPSAFARFPKTTSDMRRRRKAKQRQRSMLYQPAGSFTIFDTRYPM